MGLKAFLLTTETLNEQINEARSISLIASEYPGLFWNSIRALRHRCKPPGNYVCENTIK